jgi:hypothetical protein
MFGVVVVRLFLASHSSWLVEVLVVQEYTRLPLAKAVSGIFLVYRASLLVGV